MSKHTPGPWQADLEHTTRSGQPKFRIVAPVNGSKFKFLTVARVNYFPPDQRRKEWLYAEQEEVEANVRLMAAAPDLLAALKFCVEVIRRVVHKDAAPKIAVDAIALAEGHGEILDAEFEVHPDARP